MSQVYLSFKLPCHPIIFLLFLVFVATPVMLMCTLFVDYLSQFWGRQMMLMSGREYLIIEDGPYHSKRDSIPCFQDNFDDVDFYTLPPLNSKCTNRTFTCTKLPHEQKARVISYSRRCDGIPDCLDGRDEANCKECQTNFACPANDGQFLKCIRAAQLCDGIADCQKAEDELLSYCTVSKDIMTKAEYHELESHVHGGREFNCSKDEFKCMGHCIPMKFVCDGEPHCTGPGMPFGQEEMECNSCRGQATYCANPTSGYVKCIPRFEQCDQVIDCLDHSDERSWDVCENDSCPGRCKITDEHHDKANFERAELIRHAHPATPFMKTKTFQQTIVYCPDGQQLHVDQACSGFHPHCESQCKYCTGGAFRCTNGTECLLPARVCDGISDCADGSDELRCENITMDCNDDFRRCNGFEDCFDGRDERNCTDGCKTETIVGVKKINKDDIYYLMGQRYLPTVIEINSGFSCTKDQRCLPYLKRCDGHTDCTDGSDEKECTCSECMMHLEHNYICRKGQRCFKWNEVCVGNQTQCPEPDEVDVQYCLKLAQKQ